MSDTIKGKDYDLNKLKGYLGIIIIFETLGAPLGIAC